MSYSESFPTQRPIFSLDAANAGRLDPRCSFSRSDTPPTYAAPSAVHYWSNEKHLSSENLLLQSSDFDTSWSANGLNGTPTGGQADPSGGTDGFTLVESSGAGERWLQQAVSGSGTPTLTVYAKQNSGTRYLYLTIWNSVSNFEVALFDLAGGAAALYSGGSSSFTSVTATQTASGNGFYKCTLKATGTANLVYVGVDDSSTITGYNSAYGVKSYTGNGSSIDIAFASLTSSGATDYNATTTSIHRQYASSLKSVSYAGQPRFEYDPASDGQSMGILIEGQSTNLLAGSATIGGTYWGVVNATAQQNSAVAPDGTLTAATLVENSAGGSKVAYTNNFTPAASTTYTFSAFVKPNGRNFCMIYTGIGGVNQSSMFDLGTGSTSNLSGSGVNRATQCGNGWWRLSVTVTTTSTATHNFQILPASDATTIDYTGNGYSGLLCWGAMLEQSSHPSSYIGTTTTAVTRASDQLSVATADIGYTGGPVSLVTEFDVDAAAPVGSGVVRRFAMAQLGGTEFGLYQATYGGAALLGVAGGSVLTGSSLTAGANKAALSYDTNDVAICANGGAVTTDTSQELIDASGLNFYVGGETGGASALNGHVKRVALYNEALSDTNLQALTS